MRKLKCSFICSFPQMASYAVLTAALIWLVTFSSLFVLIKIACIDHLHLVAEVSDIEMCPFCLFFFPNCRSKLQNQWSSSIWTFQWLLLYKTIDIYLHACCTFPAPDRHLASSHLLTVTWSISLSLSLISLGFCWGSVAHTCWSISCFYWHTGPSLTIRNYSIC